MTTVADNRVEEAINVIARVILGKAVADARDDGWQDYPELGEYDWDRVVERAKEIAADPSFDEFEAAYDFLTNRGDGA